MHVKRWYVSEIIAEPIIAEPINKSDEKPPSYALATKEINLPPPKYEEIGEVIKHAIDAIHAINAIYAILK